jgi:hypothetical protein
VNVSQLPFALSPAVALLLRDVEQLAGTEVELREAEFTRFDEPAAVQGGFDRWVPHVTINPQQRQNFDAHGLAHELLHIRRFLEGAPSLETPENVGGQKGRDAELRKAFASDVTNQIEHTAIFPRLEALGFDPRALGDQWIARQVREMPTAIGEVDATWLAVKIGLAPFISRSEPIRISQRLAVERINSSLVQRGDEITALVNRYGVEKPYNLRRLYERLLRAAGVPKGALLLKELDFKRMRESREPIP